MIRILAYLYVIYSFTSLYGMYAIRTAKIPLLDSPMHQYCAVNQNSIPFTKEFPYDGRGQISPIVHIRRALLRGRHQDRRTVSRVERLVHHPASGF